MAWFRKDKKPLKARDRRELPGDVFDKCPGAARSCTGRSSRRTWNVCPTCGTTCALAAEYVSLLLDEGTFEELDADLRAADPLGSRTSRCIRSGSRRPSADGEGEAVIAGRGSWTASRWPWR
jgi:acetyl-CoA carboxylase carboxyl transferase subunit beta